VEDLDVACIFNTYVTGDPDAAVAQFGRVSAFYYAMPAYNAFLAWCGYKDAARALAETAAQGDRTAAAAVLSPELIHKLAIIGDGDACRATVRAYQQAGLNTPIVGAVSHDPAEQQATMEAFTPAAFPRQ
jgi:alkanesulfonate monooxygenase SsuD/methylene tetrahydromethanopterin reductase-like flavin-dependent oxidoreductase (luciferase family)